LAAPFLPEVLPLENLKPSITASQGQKLARERLAINMADLREELSKLKGQTNVSADMLAKKAKEMHLTFHRGVRPVSEMELTDAGKTATTDLGLNAFKEGFNRITQRTFTFTELTRVLFGDQRTYLLTQRNVIPSETEEMLFWRSEDLPVRMRSFSDAGRMFWRRGRSSRPETWHGVKLWRFVTASTRTNSIPPMRLVFWPKPRRVTCSSWTRSARSGRPAQGSKARGPRTDSIGVLRYRNRWSSSAPYPPADLPKLLLEAKRAGEAVVFLDRPGRTFYVTVIDARDEPSVSDFKKLYERSPFRDPLYDLFVLRKQDEYRKRAGRTNSQGSRRETRQRWTVRPARRRPQTLHRPVGRVINRRQSGVSTPVQRPIGACQRPGSTTNRGVSTPRSLAKLAHYQRRRFMDAVAYIR
jgi:hypothetical protein